MTVNKLYMKRKIWKWHYACVSYTLLLKSYYCWRTFQLTNIAPIISNTTYKVSSSFIKRLGKPAFQTYLPDWTFWHYRSAINRQRVVGYCTLSGQNLHVTYRNNQLMVRLFWCYIPSFTGLSPILTIYQYLTFLVGFSVSGVYFPWSVLAQFDENRLSR